MTVNAEFPPDRYVGDGTTTTYAYTFTVHDPSWIVVTVDNSLVEFTVDNGTVILADPPATAAEIIIDRAVPLNQLTAYQIHGPFPAKAHENALDKLTMAVQDSRADDRDIADELAKKADVVHAHNIEDVHGLQDQLNLKADGADLALKVNRSGDTITGILRVNVQGSEPTAVAQRALVDGVLDSLVGAIVRGVLDISGGDGSLPASPANGDVYFIGVGGTITVSDGSGPAVPTAIEAGDRIIWIESESYWLNQASIASIAASNVITTPFDDVIGDGRYHVLRPRTVGIEFTYRMGEG